MKAFAQRPKANKGQRQDLNPVLTLELTHLVTMLYLESFICHLQLIKCHFSPISVTA